MSSWTPSLRPKQLAIEAYLLQATGYAGGGAPASQGQPRTYPGDSTKSPRPSTLNKPPQCHKDQKQGEQAFEPNRIGKNGAWGKLRPVTSEYYCFGCHMKGHPREGCRQATRQGQAQVRPSWYP